MGVMSLGVPKGANVKVVAKGEDEIEVIPSVDNVMVKHGLAE